MALNVQRLKDSFEKKKERGERFVLQNNENYIRILPPSLQYFTEEVDYISYTYLMHYKLGVDGDRQSVVCPKTTNKHERCPVCEAVARLYKNATVEDKALAGGIRGKKRYIFNVLDLNNPDKGVQILETGSRIYEDLVEFVTNPKWGDLLDLDKGKNVTIVKTDAKETSSGYTEYRVMPDPTSSSVRELLPANFKEQLGALQKTIPPSLSYEELKVILEGGSLESTSKEKETAESGSAESDPAPAVVHAPIVKAVSATVQGKPPVVTVTQKCFSRDYGPRRPECLSCPIKTDCRDKFLEVE